MSEIPKLTVSRTSTVVSGTDPVFWSIARLESALAESEHAYGGGYYDYVVLREAINDVLAVLR